ncbi:hypothetical protein [Halomonas denitrificans]|nr:hypothetical protein [Halomonas denitrificans]
MRLIYRRLSRAASIALGAALLLGTAAAQESTLPLDSLGAPHCTEVSNLNQATQRSLHRLLRIVLNNRVFRQRLEGIGITPVPKRSDLRGLSNIRDAAACQRVRETLDLQGIGWTRDREMSRNVPERILMIYAMPQGGYLAYTTHYNPGSPDGGPDPIIMGHSSAYHFDSNLVLVGSTGL